MGKTTSTISRVYADWNITYKFICSSTQKGFPQLNKSPIKHEPLCSHQNASIVDVEVGQASFYGSAKSSDLRMTEKQPICADISCTDIEVGGMLDGVDREEWNYQQIFFKNLQFSDWKEITWKPVDIMRSGDQYQEVGTPEQCSTKIK